jgi:hypothetical protein
MPDGPLAGVQLGLPGIPLGGGITGALQGLLGSQAVRSIAEWMMLQNLAQAAEGPLTAEIGQLAFGQFPTLVSSPIELAAGVVRGHVASDHAFSEAKKSGYDKEPFQLLLDNAGQPLPLLALLEAWRRQIIPKEGQGAASVSLEQGIRESDLKNKWTPVVEALQWQLANPGVVIEGWLRAQISEADARAILKQNGLDDATATLMYKSAGRPPSPQELFDAMHRDLIPLDGEGGDTLSVRQGFLETDLKNKWWPVWSKLAEYLPPPRTVTAMMREGALTDEQGAALFKKAGLPDELVKAYMAAAHHQRVAASKELAKTDILAGYVDGLIPAADALTALGKLGWPPLSAQFELDIADFRRQKSLYDGAINRVKAQYIDRKVSAETARNALQALGATSAHVNELFAVWDVERANLVKRLTATDWAAAAYYKVITPEAAIIATQALGYTEYEAWVHVSNRLHGPATANPPPADIPGAYTQGP